VRRITYSNTLGLTMASLMQRNVSLQPYNSMAVSASAAYLTEVASCDQIRSAVAFAHEREIPILVLGDGTNTLFIKDFSGLVLLNRIKGIELVEESQDTVLVRVASGENWHDFVAYAIQQGWYGLENLALIPGLVGAAPIQNIGAYGVELKDRFFGLEYLNIETGKLHFLTCEQCLFAYRDSIFKNALAGQTIIVSVTLELSTVAKLNLTYPALAERFSACKLVSPTEVFNAICEIRRDKLPLPSEIPNTGSFFKNPIVDQQLHSELKKQFPKLVSFPIESQFKLAAGWLIEQAGWKEKELQGVAVHERQALVVTNPKRSTGAAVLRFAQAIQQDIEDKYAVQLEIEPQLI